MYENTRMLRDIMFQPRQPLTKATFQHQSRQHRNTIVLKHIPERKVPHTMPERCETKISERESNEIHKKRPVSSLQVFNESTETINTYNSLNMKSLRQWTN